MSQLENNGCDFLRVVLFCKGKGADKDSYRPRSDEKQWWGRRDALARCVSSFLFGAQSKHGGKTKKELVLFFDEDFARLHMTIDHDEQNGSTFPKEETLIKLWKQAAQNLRKEVRYKGIKCVIHLDPSLSFSPTISKRIAKPGSAASSIERIDTKREVLEYIQKHCSIGFLRQNRINSNPEVVLRKTNRKALLKIWDTWTKQMNSSSSTDDMEGEGSKNDSENSGYSRQLKSIYKELLQFPSEINTTTNSSESIPNDRNQVIAGTLHETAEEFPCFRFGNEEINSESSSDLSYKVCLFLGAVRDMTSNEGEVLQQVCKTLQIPFVGVRFGKVPEFTSKILSLLAFHHANHVLGISMKRLLEAKDKKRHDLNSVTIEDEPNEQSTCLNIVCTVPKSSKEISIRMEDRDHIHWRLVRVIVCSLWRSKLVSSKSSIHHLNNLYLLFEDGVTIALKEREFVEQLASKHQAAPSEFQILTALIHEIDRQSKFQDPPPPSTKNSSGDGWSRKKLAKRLAKSILKSSPIPITCAVGIDSNGTNDLVSRFYDHCTTKNCRAKDQPDQGLLAIIDLIEPPEGSKHSIRSKRTSGWNADRKAPREMYRQLLSAAKKLEIPTIQQNFLPNATTDKNDWCWDREAASIVAIQHMCYQNRVFGNSCAPANNVEPNESSGKKRKKPS